ncbi:MAG: DUF3501 family protein [Kofleriaceae bacterium]
MSPERSLIRPLTRDDVKGPALYAAIRDDFRRRIIELKRARRVLVGDRVSLVFENRHTLTAQVEEMLRAEHLTSDAQIAAELDVYNELMPTADTLSATLFIELPPGADARAELDRLIGLDEHLVLHVGPHALRAAFEPGRATSERISAVQYVRFPLPPAALAALRHEGTELVFEIDHPNYRHRAPAPTGMRASLAHDYDGVEQG